MIADYTLPTIADYTLPTIADYLTNDRWLTYLLIEMMSAVVVNILLEINCILWEQEY